MEMRGFFTGSRVYGKPKKNSDLDMVLLVTEEQLELLRRESDDWGTSGQDHSRSLRFGRLNLICVSRDEEYIGWKKGTKELIAKAPVSRKRAVKFFDKLLKKFRLKEGSEIT